MAAAQSIQLDDRGRPVHDDGTLMTQKEFNDAMNSKNAPGERTEHQLKGGPDGNPGGTAQDTPDPAPAGDADNAEAAGG
jgi:hypothetical protein